MVQEDLGVLEGQVAQVVLVDLGSQMDLVSLVVQVVLVDLKDLEE